MKPKKGTIYLLVESGKPTPYEVVKVYDGKYHIFSPTLNKTLKVTREEFNQMYYVPSVFIENDSVICNEFLNDIQEKTGRDPRTWIDFKHVVKAGTNPTIIEEIENADVIFLASCFVGESLHLFVNMCKIALDTGIRDKTIINLFEYNQVVWELSPEAKQLIKALERNNNITFLYGNDKRITEIFY